MEIFGNSKKILINEMKSIREDLNKSTTKNDKNIILDSICSIMNICNIEEYEMPLSHFIQKYIIILMKLFYLLHWKKKIY